MTEIKYIVLKLDCENNEIEVLDYFNDIRDAIKYMNTYVSSNKDYELENWYSKIFNDIKCISVYRNNYFSKKTLICRYYIKEF